MNRQSNPLLLFSAIFIPFLVLYWLTANQLFSFDAVTNAIACEANEPPRWFHSNHLLYPFLGVLWFKFERLLGYEGYAIYSLARFNTILMASALGILFLHLQKKMGRFGAAALVLFLGVTYSVWHYGVDGRAIGASVFFSVLTMTYLFHLDQKPSLNKWDSFVLGMCSLLTVLMHGIAIFHVIPLGIWMWQREKRVLPSLMYLATTFIGLLVTYTSIFILIVRPFTHGQFLNWALGYAGYGGTSNILNSNFWANGGWQILKGMWSGWQHAIVATLPGKVGDSFAINFSAGVLGMFLVPFLHARNLEIKQRQLAIALILWGALIGIFLLFWSPGQEGFRLHVLIPWVGALGVCFSGKRFFSWGVLFSAVVLFYVNFTFWFFPSSFISNNLGFQTLTVIHSRLKAGDVVLAAQPGTLPDIEVLLPYFFPDLGGGTIAGRLMAFRETNLEPLQQQLNSRYLAKSNVYFADDMFDENVLRSVGIQRGIGPNTFEEFMKGFEAREFFVLPNGHQLYRMELKRKPVI